jgi:hypothetical protein
MFGAIGFNQQDIVKDGLVLWLDANDKTSYPGTGTSWKDLSRGGNNGTLNNGPTFNSGNGGSIVFDGFDDNGVIPSGNAWGNNSFSISCACYPTFDSATYGRPMFTKWNNCGSGEFAIEYGRSGVPSGLPNKFSGLIGNAIVFETTNQYPKNNWYIVTFTYSSDGNYKFYVNGLLETSGSTGLTPSLNGNYGIGVFDGCRVVDFWSGNLSTILLYNKVLSVTEVLQNYNATKARFGL